MATHTTDWRGEPKRHTEEGNGGLLIALTQRVETIREEKGVVSYTCFENTKYSLFLSAAVNWNLNISFWNFDVTNKKQIKDSGGLTRSEVWYSHEILRLEKG